MIYKQYDVNKDDFVRYYDKPNLQIGDVITNFYLDFLYKTAIIVSIDIEHNNYYTNNEYLSIHLTEDVENNTGKHYYIIDTSY